MGSSVSKSLPYAGRVYDECRRSCFSQTKRSKVVPSNGELADLFQSERETRMRWRQHQLKNDSDPFKRSDVELGDQAPCIKDAFRHFQREYAEHFAAEYKKAKNMIRFVVADNLIEVVSQDTTPPSTLPHGGFSPADATKLEQFVSEPYSVGEATCGLRFNLARGDKKKPWLFYLPQRRFAQFVKRDGDRLLCRGVYSWWRKKTLPTGTRKRLVVEVGTVLRMCGMHVAVPLCVGCTNAAHVRGFLTGIGSHACQHCVCNV